MSEFTVKTKKAAVSAESLRGIARRLNNAGNSLQDLQIGGESYLGGSSHLINQRIARLSQCITDEAVSVESFQKALERVIRTYEETEKSILSEGSGLASDLGSPNHSQSGKDKRSLIQKFIDWIFGRDADDTDTTALEQEKAADASMRRALFNELSQDKYSQANWDKATIEERKQIVQDYMNAVIGIYGLAHVQAAIDWDDSLTYSKNSVTWGQYSPDSHTVTLNSRVLTDSVNTWDSYEMLETVGHELRHAYQHEAVDDPTRFMVSQETLDAWQDNFDHYKTSDKDGYSAYRNQIVEKDARSFQVSRGTPNGRR